MVAAPASPPSLEALRLPMDEGRRGWRFALLHAPASSAPKAAVVFAPPWAEEMNKSRRMVALQARALAQQGCAVLLPDLDGCGDSDRPLHQASWQGWVDDLGGAARWLQDRFRAPLVLWGLRSGCLLHAQVARALPAQALERIVFWQPVASGKPVLQQFLRLHSAAAALGTRAAADGPRETPRQRLQAGDTVDVAGYRLNPALANGLEEATLEAPSPEVPAHWFEIAMRDSAEPGPALVQAATTWREAGCRVDLQLVRGPAFWQTVEIETVPDLVARTTAAVCGVAP